MAEISVVEGSGLARDKSKPCACTASFGSQGFARGALTRSPSSRSVPPAGECRLVNFSGRAQCEMCCLNRGTAGSSLCLVDLSYGLASQSNPSVCHPSGATVEKG